MKKSWILAAAITLLAGCSDVSETLNMAKAKVKAKTLSAMLSHRQIIGELKNLKNGRKYELKRDKTPEINYPDDYVSLVYSHKRGFIVADASESATFMLGHSYVDINADGYVDLQINIHRHGVVGSRDSGICFNKLSAKECDRPEAARWGTPKPGTSEFLEAYRKAQTFFEQETRKFYESEMEKEKPLPAEKIPAK